MTTAERVGVAMILVPIIAASAGVVVLVFSDIVFGTFGGWKGWAVVGMTTYIALALWLAGIRKEQP